MAANPYRPDEQLDAPMDGLYTTRRGDDRAMYAIDEAVRAFTVVSVAHRRAYRSR